MTPIMDVASFAALIVAAVAIYKAWKITPAEVNNLSSDTTMQQASAAKIFEEAALMAANRALRLDARIAVLEDERSDFYARIALLETNIMRLENVQATLRNWSERLVHQVTSLGGTPVKMIPTTTPRRKPKKSADLGDPKRE